MRFMMHSLLLLLALVCAEGHFPDGNSKVASYPRIDFVPDVILDVWRGTAGVNTAEIEPTTGSDPVVLIENPLEDVATAQRVTAGCMAGREFAVEHQLMTEEEK